jgi:hypothetical protein
MVNREKVPDGSATIPTPQKFSWGRILALLSIVLVILMVLGREFYKVAMPNGLGGNTYVPTPEPEAQPIQTIQSDMPKEIIRGTGNAFVFSDTEYELDTWVEDDEAIPVATFLNRSFPHQATPSNDMLAIMNASPRPMFLVKKERARIFFLKDKNPDSPESYRVLVTATKIKIIAANRRGWMRGAKAVIGLVQQYPVESLLGNVRIPNVAIEG